MSRAKHWKRSMTRAALAAGLVTTALVATTAAPAAATAFTVNSLADASDAAPGDGVCHTGAGRGTCTLRAAIEEANATPGDDVIHLPPGTIELTSGQPLAVVGGGVELAPARRSTSSLVPATKISGGWRTRLFVVDRGGSLTLRGAELTGGSAKPPPLQRTRQRAGTGFPKSVNDGGAIWVGPTGSVDLNRVDVHRNRAVGNGGGLFIAAGGTVETTDTRIGRNRSESTVGGIDNRGTLTMRNSELSGNVAVRGTGGLDNRGSATLVNVTVSSNRLSHGGQFPNVAGILNRGTLDINSSTIAHNELHSLPGSLSAGIAALPGSGQQTRMTNSILAHNVTYGASPFDDCALDLSQDSHHNLIANATGCGLPGDTSTWIVGASALFDYSPPGGGSGFYGHPTRTWHPSANSPAIDAGFDPAVDTVGRPCAPTDQLGEARAACDLGAAEYVG